jgi:asparagine synthase (glutamine-hydrolysing)
LFQCDDNQRIKSHIFSQEQYFFSQKEINNFLLQSPDFLFDEKISTKRKLSAAEEQALFDIKYYLKDDLLVKVDRASMQSALEVRVPLLDHRIVEFALNLNPALKIKAKEQKYLLKQVLYDFVPKKYFDRPKWGFSIPLEKWLQTDLKYLLDKYTEKELVERCNIFDFQEVDSLKKANLNGQTYLYNRLWLIMVLHKNLEKYTNE